MCFRTPRCSARHHHQHKRHAHHPHFPHHHHRVTTHTTNAAFLTAHVSLLTVRGGAPVPFNCTYTPPTHPHASTRLHPPPKPNRIKPRCRIATSVLHRGCYPRTASASACRSTRRCFRGLQAPSRNSTARGRAGLKISRDPLACGGEKLAPRCDPCPIPARSPLLYFHPSPSTAPTSFRVCPLTDPRSAWIA